MEFLKKCVSCLAVLSIILCQKEVFACTDNEISFEKVNYCITRIGFGHGGIPLPCRQNDEFTCKITRICVLRSSVMDGKHDCNTTLVDDRSDEEERLNECNLSEFRCSSGRCIPREWIQDNKTDCPDREDQNITLPECRKDTEFLCESSGRCILRHRIRDGVDDCGDGADETAQLDCLADVEFKCVVGGRCIPRSWRNNQVVDCLDESDEDLPGSVNGTCTDAEFTCFNGRRCIPKSYLCDGIDHCGDCSDEIESCTDPVMLRCPQTSGQRCILWSSTCLGSTDCPTGPDDVTSLTGFKCYRENDKYCNLPQFAVRDPVPSCLFEEDVCYVNGSFRCAKCLDEVTVVSSKQICDGVVDCPDLSDECLCSEKVTTSNISREICQSVRYDVMTRTGSTLCDIGEVFCADDKLCINKGQVCDGVIDCPISRLDESACGKKRERILNSNSGEKMFQCNLLPDIIFDHTSDDWFLALFLRENFVPYATRCDGIIECYAYEDECSEKANCSFKPPQCDKITLTMMGQTPRTSSFPSEKYHVPHRACGMFDMPSRRVCDGISTCSNGEDEIYCSHRFFCDAGSIGYYGEAKKIVNIPLSLYCDGISHCVDEKDEANCTSETHFYCESGDPLFVPVRKVLDGISDCKDQSDECPSDILKDSAISSRFQLITSVPLRIIIWIMTTLALVCNVAVFSRTMRKLVSDAEGSHGTSPSSLSTINNILILNLSFADFLMGLVLLIIIAHSVAFSGRYCFEDKAWRSSATCTAIGVFSVVSSEASLLTLVGITSFRLYTIYRPYVAKDARKRFILIWLIFVWFFAFLVALLPLAASQSSNMISEMWIWGNNTYFPSDRITLFELQVFSRRSSVLGGLNETLHATEDWYFLEEFLRTTFPSHAPLIRGYFGYYSASGLCMPRFYKLRGDLTTLNALSITIISINFIAIVYIASAYAAIYVRTNLQKKSKAIERDDRTKRFNKLHQKFAVIVTTNFCCWLPICIMTFVSLSGTELDPIAYAVSAIILLPINSSVNPLIYSDVFPFMWKKGKKQFNRIRNMLTSQTKPKETLEFESNSVNNKACFKTKGWDRQTTTTM
ncbi:uncharacterized protein LOC143453146 isoform X2 [Clavelina lepadiformis]|uniref:uncharacterized protein LOC143453146 isoform X2 n=1 Tax=Clavelina lepadiformis TaxID=159417 RepID=UPI0040410D00